MARALALPPTASELGDLRAKYEEMLRLRLAHLERDEPDPRPAMAALARRYPGALREIDELPLDEIRARIAALASCADDPARAAPWMAASCLFHALTRGALAAKRWLAGRKDVDDEVRRKFDRASATFVYAADARAWADDLARIARPPRGRVTDLVFARIAAHLDVDDAEARRLVFGEPRRSRRLAAPRDPAG